jgi:hypothetical protein
MDLEYLISGNVPSWWTLQCKPVTKYMDLWRAIGQTYLRYGQPQQLEQVFFPTRFEDSC